MRLIAMPAVAVAACTALGLSAPAATAADGDDLVAGVSPTTVRVGQTVQLTLRNCSEPSEGGIAEGSLVGGETTARSPIGLTLLEPRADGTLTGTATITADATPGTKQTIYFACASNTDEVAEATVTIAR